MGEGGEGVWEVGDVELGFEGFKIWVGDILIVVEDSKLRQIGNVC